LTTGGLAALKEFRKRELSVKGEEGKPLVLVTENGARLVQTRTPRTYKFLGTTEDMKIIPMGYAALINHADDPAHQNLFITRRRGLQKRSPPASEMVYEALRDIAPGEELLRHYGDKIDAAIKRDLAEIRQNTAYQEQTRDDWQVFLRFDLYGLASHFTSSRVGRRSCAWTHPKSKPVGAGRGSRRRGG
jgi:hypothetical protein